MRDGRAPMGADAALEIPDERIAQWIGHSLQMTFPTPSPLSGGLWRRLRTAAQVVDYCASRVQRSAVMLVRAAVASLTIGYRLLEGAKILRRQRSERTTGLNEQARRNLRTGARARPSSITKCLCRSLVA